MHIIAIIVIGFLVGLVAKFLTPGRDPSGFFVTAGIGIAGSLIASYLGQSMGWYAPGDAAGFIASVFGAIVLLVVYHLVARRSIS